MRKRLSLNTLQNSRKSLAALCRDLHSDPDADVAWYRCQGYMLKTLLDYFKTEMDLPSLVQGKAEERKFDYGRLSVTEMGLFLSFQKKARIDEMEEKKRRVIELLTSAKLRREAARKIGGNGNKILNFEE